MNLDTVSMISSKQREISDEPLLLVGGMSRSGTTLLATVFDSHPEISLGSELIPSDKSSPAEILQLFRAALTEANGEFGRVGSILRQRDKRQIGSFLNRCNRAGITSDEVVEVLEDLSQQLSSGISSYEDRLLLAYSMMRKRWLRDGTALFGFKLNNASISATAAAFPNARFVCLVRDPIDVTYSHEKQGFDRSASEIGKAWYRYAKSYREFANKHPDRAVVIRYEDLVRSPRRTLERAFAILPISLKPEIFDFHRSNAKIFESGHPNLAQIRANFSDRSIAIGHTKLQCEIKNSVLRQCGNLAKDMGYATRSLMIPGQDPAMFPHLATTDARRSYDLERTEVASHGRRLQRARKFLPAEYDALLQPYASHKSLRHCDYIRLADQGDDKILLIRHDVDHDIETACEIARWEFEKGFKATYCILHTAWYYGAIGDDGRHRHSRLLISGLQTLLELGHEVNFHNNLVATALQHGTDPIEMLEQELEFFDSLGIPVIGTSTHGDRLCRQLNFRNWEIFSECCDGRHGGPRTIEHKLDNGHVNRVSLGTCSMQKFGLEYEAYDIHRDIYHSDSGGRMRTKDSGRGRRMFGREEGRGEVVGVLTHPIWWNFDIT